MSTTAARAWPVQACRDCAQTGPVGPRNGRCPACTRRRRASRPQRETDCVACGRRTTHRGNGRCMHCYHHDASRVRDTVERLGAELGSRMPAWLPGFAEHLTDRLCADRAITLLNELMPLLDNEPSSPTAVLAAARQPGPLTVGPLARALQAYFVASGLALALDQPAHAARQRRERRIAGVPEAFRPPVATFAAALLHERDRARRAATLPCTDRTIEINLAAVRDLARFLTAHRPHVESWAMVGVGDIEAFLAGIASPANRARQLQALRPFFRHARRRKLLLVDPTRGIKANSNSAFHGEVLSNQRQRELFQRWTASADALHPQEPAVGLLGLLHAASPHELRMLRVADVDLAAATAKLGHRPQPTPLDPATAEALRRCPRMLGNHRDDGYLLVTQKSKTTDEPASTDYLEKLLAGAGVSPLQLRATRLAHLVTVLDPVVVAEAFGLRRGAVLHYLADTVTEARLPNP